MGNDLVEMSTLQSQTWQHAQVRFGKYGSISPSCTNVHLSASSKRSATVPASTAIVLPPSRSMGAPTKLLVGTDEPPRRRTYRPSHNGDAKHLFCTWAANGGHVHISRSQSVRALSAWPIRISHRVWKCHVQHPSLGPCPVALVHRFNTT